MSGFAPDHFARLELYLVDVPDRTVTLPVEGGTYRCIRRRATV